MPENIQWNREVRKRLKELKLAPARETEIAEELAQHLESEYEGMMSRGVAEPEARRIALEGIGKELLDGLGKIEKSEKWEPAADPKRKSNFSADLWQDLRYAIRMLKKNPGFTALAVLSLAFGIGGNAAMFSVVNAVLIRPLPYRDSGRLVQATNYDYYPPGGLVALQQGTKTMEVAGYSPGVDLNLAGQDEAWRLEGALVSANLFQLLGVEVMLGRGFRPGEDQPGRDNLVILSHALWQDKFHADPAIVGRVIQLGDAERQVIAVMTSGFAFPDAGTQFWIPLHLDPRNSPAYWSQGFMPVIARLHSGVTPEQAQREMRSVTRDMRALFPYPMGRGWNEEVTLLPLQQFMVSDIRTKLIVLQCAIGLVLLIACVNVASLLLARASSRQKEMAIRTALGASPGRIVRQLLTESVALALAGGALGIALAVWGFSLMKLALPAGAAGSAAAIMNWQVVVFVSILSVATGLIFGLAPALSASKQDLAGTIKTGSQRSSGAARTQFRSVLIMGEVAITVVLAVSAGLLIKSLWILTQVNPGFQPGNILTLRVSPNQSLCRERAACIAFFQELVRRTEEISGVHDIAVANTLPMAANIPSIPVAVEGHPYVPGQTDWPMFWAGAVTPSYFRVMRIPILAGRALTDSDGEKSAPVVIVSAAMARRYWPGENPIGKHIRPVFENNWRTVVGVAGDVRQYDLADHSPYYIRGAMYMPYPQSVMNDRQLPAAMTLIVRTGADTAALASHIREVVKSLNPSVPVSEIRPMESLVNDSTQQSRSMTWLFIAFAGAALVFAGIGTYGVVSYSTSQRTFEIGVRVALGASRRDIFGSVLGQSLRLVIAGLAAGILTSLGLTRLLKTFLYGTAATDPLTFLAVCAVLVAVALLAGYAPARRAARVDPLTALRVD
jgi:putative ABC transport system permease protein